MDAINQPLLSVHDLSVAFRQQGKENLQAPWLAFAGFFVVGGLLVLLIFIGEGVRDAFDPRKTSV